MLEYFDQTYFKNHIIQCEWITLFNDRRHHGNLSRSDIEQRMKNSIKKLIEQLNRTLCDVHLCECRNDRNQDKTVLIRIQWSENQEIS